MPELSELDALGQSPWLDNLRRDWLADGTLERWIDSGIRGLTSNPSIFQKAIAGSDQYDEQFGALMAAGTSVNDAYWQLVTSDIEGALALLRPVYDATNGTDGFVSVEVDPSLARDTEGTTTAARELHASIDEPNLMVKIPGTVEGLAAIQTMISEKRSINVTLIFSVERYRDVMEVYLSGLEAASGDLSKIASVASFFISRVDNEVDGRLDAIGTEQAAALRGHTAIDNAKAAYIAFLDTFSGSRWQALAARGAQVQRPLWASTSTKDPSFPDTLYVDTMIGPETVNTMPDGTIDAWTDHGVASRQLDTGLTEALRRLDALAALGIDIEEVAQLLEDQGVASFKLAFDDLLATLAAKRPSP